MSAKGQRYSIEDLLLCAKRAVAPHDNIDHQISAIEAYSAVFDQLFGVDGTGTKDLDSDALEEAQLAHQQVLALSDSLKSSVSHDLKSLMAKGRATLKYVDHLPRRISITRPQRG